MDLLSSPQGSIVFLFASCTVFSLPFLFGTQGVPVIVVESTRGQLNVKKYTEEIEYNFFIRRFVVEKIEFENLFSAREFGYG